MYILTSAQYWLHVTVSLLFPCLRPISDFLLLSGENNKLHKGMASDLSSSYIFIHIAYCTSSHYLNPSDLHSFFPLRLFALCVSLSFKPFSFSSSMPSFSTPDLNQEVAFSKRPLMITLANVTHLSHPSASLFCHWINVFHSTSHNEIFIC